MATEELNEDVGMRLRALATCLMIASIGAVAGCVSTPQTKVLITPVGAIGVHTFRQPDAQRPTPSEIDRMTASIRRAPERSSNEQSSN